MTKQSTEVISNLTNFKTFAIKQDMKNIMAQCQYIHHFTILVHLLKYGVKKDNYHNHVLTLLYPARSILSNAFWSPNINKKRRTCSLGSSIVRIFWISRFRFWWSLLSSPYLLLSTSSLSFFFRLSSERLRDIWLMTLCDWFRALAGLCAATRPV